MSYATEADIESMFRELDFSDTDAAVNSDDVAKFLDNTTAIINSRVAPLYQTPITELANPESFKILKQIQMFKVACIVDDILNNYAEADKKPEWCKKAKYLLDMYAPMRDPKTCKQCPPTAKLPDAVYLGTETQKNRIKLGATTEPVFKKGSDNW